MTQTLTTGPAPATDTARVGSVVAPQRLDSDCHVTWKAGVYVWVGPKESRFTPKAAGFAWNPEDVAWQTDDVDTALRLAGYMDAAAQEAVSSAAGLRFADVVASLPADHDEGIPSPSQASLEDIPEPVSADCALTHSGERFVWTGGYCDRETPRAAGFSWDREHREWATPYVEVALRLEKYMDSYALAVVRGEAHELSSVIEASHAAAAADLDVPSPEGMAYRPFQLAGVAYALSRPGTLIGDEMGLGKTIEAIGVCNSLPDARFVLIVAPLSVKRNWADELNRWLTRDLRVAAATAGSWPEDADVVIIHPDVLSRQTAHLYEREWDLVIVDEAHRFKNPAAQRSAALFGVRGARRLALTGTPIPNRPKEIYSVLHWLAPEAWGDWPTFALRYCGAQRRDGKVVGGHGASNLAELQNRLRSTLMVRRTKAAVLPELPPKTRQVLVIDPADVTDAGVAGALRAALRGEKQAVERHRRAEAAGRAHARARKAVKRASSPQEQAAADEAFRAAITELDASRAGYTSLREIAIARHETARAKLPLVVEHVRGWLDDDERRKVTVWAHHRDIVDDLAASLAEYGVVTIKGGDSETSRSDAATAFQADDTKVRVFVGSITAAGEGITLHAASVAVFAEQDWVPGRLDQAEDRIHRLGQEDPVLVQHLVVDQSIDARMAQSVLGKRGVIATALDDPALAALVATADQAEDPAE